MAIIDEVIRLEGAATIIKAKTAELSLSKPGGGTISSADKMDVQASAINLISKRTPVTQTLDATTTAVTLSQGYYGADSTIAVSVLSAPSVTLSGSEQTIACDDKMMDGDITIPAANVYRTGSSEPTSSTPGNEGDLYLVVGPAN